MFRNADPKVLPTGRGIEKRQCWPDAGREEWDIGQVIVPHDFAICHERKLRTSFQSQVARSGEWSFVSAGFLLSPGSSVMAFNINILRSVGSVGCPLLGFVT